MDAKKIDRINELYHKSQSVGLTEKEKSEQAALRREYLAAIRGSLRNNLNNILLRKLRIALAFKSYDMIKIFKLGGVEISEGELSALFRSEDHKNYKECGDKYIRVFLKGLIEYCRD